MGAAPESLSVSEGPCLEPGHLPLSCAGVTAREPPVCHLGPWCPHSSAESARTQESLAWPLQPLAGRAAQPWLLGSGRDYPVHPPETAVDAQPLDVGLLVGISGNTTAYPRTFASLNAIRPYCQYVGTTLAPLLATAGDAKRNRQERDFLSSNSRPDLRPLSSQCH